MHEKENYKIFIAAKFIMGQMQRANETLNSLFRNMKKKRQLLAGHLREDHLKVRYYRWESSFTPHLKERVSENNENWVKIQRATLCIPFIFIN